MRTVKGCSGKRYRWVLALAFVAIIGAHSAYEYFQEPDHLRLNLIQRLVVTRIVAKWQDRIKALPEDVRTIVDYSLLWQDLNLVERFLLDRIFAIDPKNLGFKGPFHSTKNPDNLIRVEPADYKAGKMWIFTGKVQYCPRHSYGDFQRIMAAMRKDLGKALFIESAYRSPGQQAFLFLFYLVTSHNYSLYETARLSALPGYSEHNDPINGAIDFINEDGIDDKDFEALPEYKWLLEHAAEFNFYLSFPRNNDWGVGFEPWHWHWEAPKAAGASMVGDR